MRLRAVRLHGRPVYQVTMSPVERMGRLVQPDERFDRFDLAEEETPGLEFLRVVPVLEQTPGDRGGAGPAGLAPRLDPRADTVDQGDFDEDAGVVEGAGVFGSDDVSGGAAARHEVEQARRAVVTPVVRRLLTGRVDDEPVDGGLRHHSGSGGTAGSSCAISLIASISASFMTSAFGHSAIRPGRDRVATTRRSRTIPAADAHGFFVVAGTVEASAGGHMSRGGDEAGRYENVGIDEHADQRPSPDESSGPPVRRAMSS